MISIYLMYLFDVFSDVDHFVTRDIFSCGGIKNLKNQLEARPPESSALSRKQHIKIPHEVRGGAVGPLLSISYAASADDVKQHVDGFNHRFIHDFFITTAAKRSNHDSF